MGKKLGMIKNYMQQCKNYIYRIKKDFELSVKNEEKLGFINYKRISSRFTPLYKYIITPFAVYFLIINIKSIIKHIVSGESFMFSSIVILILILVYYKIILFSNAFLAIDERKILIINPLLNSIRIINEENIYDINGSNFLKIDIITLKYWYKKNLKKIYFLAGIRFMKAGDEHPIVKEVKYLLKTYKQKVDD